ncbi:MAG: TadE/TadG family type IV pilus assembly protein [Telluria sp.]
MRPATAPGRIRQRGVATVELVFVVLWMWLLGVAMYALLSFMYQYVVLKHATHSAATYAATIPHSQLYTYSEILAARAEIDQIVRGGLAQSGVAVPEDFEVLFFCGDYGDNCKQLDATLGLPIHVTAEYNFIDPFWNVGQYGAGGNMGNDAYWLVKSNSSAVFLK